MLYIFFLFQFKNPLLHDSALHSSRAIWVYCLYGSFLFLRCVWKRVRGRQSLQYTQTLCSNFPTSSGCSCMYSSCCLVVASHFTSSNICMCRPLFCHNVQPVATVCLHWTGFLKVTFRVGCWWRRREHYSFIFPSNIFLIPSCQSSRLQLLWFSWKQSHPKVTQSDNNNKSI